MRCNMYKVTDITNEQKVLKKVQTLVIEHDPDSPVEAREDPAALLTTFVGREHRNYTIGDTQDEPLSAMLEELHNNNIIADSTYERLVENAPAYFDEEERDFILKKFNEHYVWTFVYMYDHSGVAFSTGPFNCGWDSGTAGIIFVSNKRIREEFSVKRISPKLRKYIETVLVSDIETYNQWVNGEIYAFTVWSHYENEAYDEGEIIDDCGGFFGSDYKTNGIADNASLDDIHTIIEHT